MYEGDSKLNGKGTIKYKGGAIYFREGLSNRFYRRDILKYSNGYAFYGNLFENEKNVKGYKRKTNGFLYVVNIKQ